MTLEEKKLLAKKALEMRSFSYTPYSHFTVGAALAGTDGHIYTGCNIENASFSPTICAERTAFSKAVSEGVRTFSAVAIAGGKEGEAPEAYCPPCGVCRQVMSEFCDSSFTILLVKSEDDVKEMTLDEIMPFRFDLLEK